jgi:hypothetical protein
MKLTYIYVKQAPSGLLYLGKTVKNIKINPHCYLGSGKYWLEHLKSRGYHAKDIKTWILHETTDLEDLKLMGLYYSNLFDVVNSNDWANLKLEEGDGGMTRCGENHPMKNKELALKVANVRREKGWIVTEETKQRQREAKLKNPSKYWEGKERSQETKDKIKETKRNNPYKRPHSPETIEKLRQAAIRQHMKKTNT